MSRSAPVRPAPWSRVVGFAGVILLALCAAASLDRTLASAARDAPLTLVDLGQFVTAFGTSEYMFAFSGLVAAVAVVAIGRGHVAWHGGSLRLIAERALYVFAAVAVSGIVDQGLKHLIGRARPVLLTIDGPFSFHPLSLADRLASFPSGHTTSAFAAAVALGYMRPGWRPALIGAAALIGASRVLVGAHYPSDVVGGAALGSAVSLALARDFARRGLAFTLRAGRAAMIPLRPGRDDGARPSRRRAFPPIGRPRPLGERARGPRMNP